MRTAQNDLYLIYPFVHNLDSPSSWWKRRAFSRRLKNLEQRWVPWWNRFSPPSPETLDGMRENAIEELPLATPLDNTYFFLPYVRHLLFPETLRPELLDKDLPTQVRALARMIVKPLDQYNRLIGTKGVLRMTLRPESPLLSRSAISIVWGSPTVTIPISIEWCDCFLFPQKIGFLVLKVRTKERFVDSEILTDLMSQLRYVHKKRLSEKLAFWRIESEEGTVEVESRTIVDYLVQGLTTSDGEIATSLRAFVEHPPAQYYSLTSNGQVYGEQFRQLVFAELDQLTNPVRNREDELFATSADEVVWELATRRKAAGSSLPHAEFVASQPGRIAMFQNWLGMATRDSLAFVSVSRNSAGALPTNTEYDYLPLYLLVLYQHVRLSLQAGETGTRNKPNRIRPVWTGFLSFRNSTYFAEVTPRRQGNDLYRRLQEGLGVQSLFTTVREGMLDLREHLETLQEEKQADLLNWLTVVVAPLGIGLAVLGMDSSTLDSLRCALSGICGQQVSPGAFAIGVAAATLLSMFVLVGVRWTKR